MHTSLRINGVLRLAHALSDELRDFMAQTPDLVRDWDKQYGDRMQKLVFIGQHLDREAITAALDACLVKA